MVMMVDLDEDEDEDEKKCLLPLQLGYDGRVGLACF